MSDYKDVRTQAELDAALAAGDFPVCRGNGYFDAYGSATVRAFGSATVRASKYVAVHRHGSRATVTGGVLIQVPLLTDAVTWLDFYGIPVDDGKVVLFKAVNDQLESGYGMPYPVGETVTAPDWRNTNACGNGLHLCATPHHARRYNGSATKSLACQVSVADIRVIEVDGVSDKVKVRACLVLYEVDLDGERLPEPVAAKPKAKRAAKKKAS